MRINQLVDGPAIRKARILKGFGTGKALADEIGLSWQHMLRIERGVRQPSAEAYHNILKALGVDEEGAFLLEEKKSSRSGQGQKVS